MKNSNDLVSILLPVFKSEAHLKESVQSLLDQTHKNIEIVAVVDYLGDNSLKILKEMKRLDKRIRIYSNPQRYGLAVSLNKCINKSKGRFLAFMDHEGIAAKTRIKKQLAFLLNNEGVAAVGGQATLIDEKGRKVNKSDFPLEHEEVYKKLISGESMIFETAMVDKTRLPKDLLKFKKNTRYPFLYAEVFMRMTLYKEIGNLKENVLFKRRSEKFYKDQMMKKFSFVKLVVQSTASYDYKPSLRSLFYPITRDIFTFPKLSTFFE